MPDTLLQPEERVLSTLNADGTRRWLKPRLSPGRFWHKRRAIAYLLIIVFTALPYIMINGKPAILLDIINRRFTFFGKTLFATDTLLLALFMMIVFVTVFMLTAIFGRVWCGWGCPQTVYLEFVFRPIERLFMGKPGTRSKKTVPGWRKVAMYVVYLLIAAFLAHTFLSYFVGIENLRKWILGSPLDHPVAFIVMAFVTAMMLFDFGFFREQLCIVACPYGRMQSVMLDRASLIVGYDAKRGEPRGKAKRPKKSEANDVPLDVIADQRGDCIDCTMCVQTCPTGIDIRDGLQMECVHCTQCMDACDAIMDKIGRPRGLIRYSSQEALDTGRSRILRPRVIVYPVILLVLITAFVIVLSTKSLADVTLLRVNQTELFHTMPDGAIANDARVSITNRSDQPVLYSVSVVEPAGISVEYVEGNTPIAPEENRSIPVVIVAPPEVFTATTQQIVVRVVGDDGYETRRKFPMLGPYWKADSP